MPAGQPPVQNLLVLTKITAILDAFTLADPELPLSEIRTRTGLPQSTAQRLVANLVEQGFLDRTRGGYRIGVRMLHWAAPAMQGLEAVDIIRPVLDEMRDTLGETAAVFRESQGHRVCIALAETRQVLRRAIRVGQILPLHAGSAGRVILAWTPDRLAEILQRDLESFTDETIVERDQLAAVVKETAVQGYAVTTGERQTGASGLSAPIFTAQGELFGALTVMGPTSRMPEETCREWAPYVLERAEQLTRTLGGRHPDER
ncbi:IclR family transcriptional regulator [Microbacterium phosphatis]|uniref:IclR family transcriptional regulator n=1 Tax=Microbacterium phosphatis TaxID=3140248 RepID=UPI0031408F57